MNSTLPLLVVFGLDYVLWQFQLDHIICPCTIIEDKVIDKFGEILKYYPDVPAIFEKLKNLNIKIVIAEISDLYDVASHITNLFGWDKYVLYHEIYPANSIKDHLENIKKKSKIPFDKMIFFSDRKVVTQDARLKLGVLLNRIDEYDEPIINAASNLGVFQIATNGTGITMNMLETGFKEYALQKT